MKALEMGREGGRRKACRKGSYNEPPLPVFDGLPEALLS